MFECQFEHLFYRMFWQEHGTEKKRSFCEMAAARKSISIADAVSYVLADHDSDFEHSESESSSDEDQ